MTILLEIALKSFLVFAAAGAAGLALRRAAASTRHLVWTLAVITVLLLPAAVILGPRQPVAVAEGSLLAALAPAVERAANPASTAGSNRGETGQAARELPPAAEIELPGSAVGGSLPDAERPDDGSASPGLGVEPPRVPLGDANVALANGSRGRYGSTTAGAIAFALWLAGAALVILVVLLERAHVGRLARRARGSVPPALIDVLTRACADLGLRRLPRLRIGEPGSMPMTWGTLRPVVLLPAEAADWSTARLETVLRHELAHIRRRDDLTHMLATLVTALHWFDPLAWVALRRLRVERELACDDAVLRLGARPSGYAEELLRIADEFRHPAASGLAAQSMARPSQLHHRLRAVLEESRNRQAMTRGRALLGATTAVLLALPLAAFAVAAPASQAAEPLPVMTPLSGATLQLQPATSTTGTPSPPTQQVSECWAPGVDRSSRSTTETDANLRILEWESAGCRAELRLQGDLTFNQDFTEVVGISPGGNFVLEHEEGGTRRRLELRPGPGGAPQWTWRVDGREQAYDAAAQQWFSGMLVSLLRATGIAADQRTAWLYRQGGTRAVLDEVAMMYSSSPKARYLRVLLQQDGLGDDDLIEVVQVVRADVDSNSAKGRVLEALGTRYPDRVVGGALETAYWDAVASIESNSTTMRLLVDLVADQPQNGPMVGRVLRSAATNIDSNSTLASFLRRLQRQYPEIATRGPQAALFWETAERIDSSSTMRSFLLDIGEGAPVDDPDLLPIIFDAAQASISSNSTLADFIRSMERRYPGIAESGPMRDEFWATVDLVDSSSTLSGLLLDLASGKSDDSAMLDLVLEQGRRIDSSSQRGRFLVTFADAHGGAARGRLADDMLEAAREIDSRSNRERTLRALQERGIG